MKHIKLCLLFFIFIFKINAEINLEDNTDNFILDTKRIYLKEYPEAFNPSIIRWNNKLLLSFRIVPNPLFTIYSKMGLVFLDDNFDPISKPELLDTQDHTTLIPSRAEDGRLIQIQDKLYIIYGDNKENYICRGSFRVYISEINYDGEHFSIGHTDCLKDFEGASPYFREKNWVPFDYNGSLMLAYSLTPHLIFQPLLGTEKCETISKTLGKINWNYGELRGGTPALLDGDRYISFFHSSIDMVTAHSNKRCISHYFMGAYTFKKDPPFQITKISKEPIKGKGFYQEPHYKPYWKPVRCVFPCGLLIEEPFIYVSYGRQDHELWIVKMDKQALLDSLLDVEQVQ